MGCQGRHDALAGVVQDAARALAEAGAIVEETRPPHLDQVWDFTMRYWRSSELTGQEIEQLMRDWDRFRSAILGFVERYEVILCPVADAPAGALGTEGNGSYCLPYSLTGYPCAVVRAGTSPEGLPIGVQVVGRPWREDVAPAAARQIASAFGGWRPPRLRALCTRKGHATTWRDTPERFLKRWPTPTTPRSRRRSMKQVDGSAESR